MLRCSSSGDSDALQGLLDAEQHADSAPNSKSLFDSRTDVASAKMYFSYYGELMHQQNMLQVRGLRGESWVEG